MQHGTLNIVCEASISMEPIQGYVTADDAGIVMNLLSLVCANSQDSAFSFSAVQHLTLSDYILCTTLMDCENIKVI